MVAISAFLVTQHSQIFSRFFRNRIQCIALYQLHNSQALLNFRRGYYIYLVRDMGSYYFLVGNLKLEEPLHLQFFLGETLAKENV